MSGFDEPHLERRLASLEMLRKLHKRTKSDPLKAEIVAAFDGPARRSRTSTRASTAPRKQSLTSSFPRRRLIEAAPPAPESAEPVEPAPQVRLEEEKKPFEIRIQPGGASRLHRAKRQDPDRARQRGTRRVHRNHQDQRQDADRRPSPQRPLLNGRGPVDTRPPQPARRCRQRLPDQMGPRPRSASVLVLVFFFLVARGCASAARA